VIVSTSAVSMSVGAARPRATAVPSSAALMDALETTGTSLLPVTVIVTVVVEPSLSVTVNTSLATWPAASACAAAPSV
jgi:hypothetical protein